MTMDPAYQRLIESRARVASTMAAISAGQPAGTAAANARNARSAEREYVRALDVFLGRDPADDVARLSASYPVALLPIRIETKFDTGDSGPVLKVRVYPDELVADPHEPELTDDEAAAGRAYWQLGWDPAAEPDAWRGLLVRYASPRAAWIVRANTPRNLSQRPTGTPAFPAVPLKPASWSRPVLARLLPDRWLVLCYRDGGLVRRGVGRPIPDPLTLTVSPAVDPADADSVTDISGDGLLLDNALLWTVDFATAVAVGMGIAINVDAQDQTRGFDRVLVYGVKPSLDPLASAARLGELLDAHHYSRGLALVPQGTPTNNTGSAASGFPPPDSTGSISFGVERAASLLTEASDGQMLARALGIDPGVLDHVAGAGGEEQRRARAMNRAMWPVSWGYFLDQLLDPLVPSNVVVQARDFFVAWVRGRGPLPAFRVGSVPYGLLPVTSLAQWRVRHDAGGVSRFLPRLLRRLLPFWVSGIDEVPRIGKGDPDQALIDILSQDASAREIWIRPLIGGDVADNLAEFLSVPWDSRVSHQENLIRNLQKLWRGGSRVPRVLRGVFEPHSGRFRFAIVADVLSETAELDFNYLRWVRSASVADLRLERFPPGVTPATALLYRLTRHGALLEYRRTALDVLARAGQLDADERREPELIGIVPGTETRQTVWDRLDVALPGVTGSISLGDYLNRSVKDLGTSSLRRLSQPMGRRPLFPPTPATSDLKGFHDAIEQLESVPSAELDRLFTETLDTCANRIDAWITALASERLALLRGSHPEGIHLGAFGWVENLQPAVTQLTRMVPGFGVATIQPANGGFIHAPSMTHAAAAAVLRNGYLSRSGPGRERYAIDLSSARVRAARWFLGAIREGQSLRALLGYQFERGLHEREVERYIEPFRQLYPLPERAEPPAIGATEGLSPRDVVDGLALADAAAAGTIPFGANPDLPAFDPDLSKVQRELGALTETLDAVSDLLSAESVYQLVRGTTAGASASLDAQAKGVRPPDPEVIRVPRGGIPLTHRIAIVVGGAAAPNEWSVIPETARSRAEPRLDAWLASLIGDPTTVRARVRCSGPGPGDPNVVVLVSLNQLGLRPLDLLPLAGAASLGDQPVALDPISANPLADGSELDRRLVTAAVGGSSMPAKCEVSYEADTGWMESGIRTFPEILELLRAVRELVGHARALRPADLVPPEVSIDAVLADPLTSEATSRAADALTGLHQVRGSLAMELANVPEPPPGAPEPDLASLRQALLRAAEYGAVEFPPLVLPSASAERRRLTDLAVSALSELERRETLAANTAEPSARVQTIFGREFVFLPRFLPGAATELQSALNQGPALGVDDLTKRQWLQQILRVRQPLAPWARVELYTRCLGTAPGPFALAQLPFQPGARWVGLPFAADHPPAARRTSLGLFHAGLPATTEPWTGLFLDEWTEVIPAIEETTAIGFHYDDPGAEAPQAVLLGVCPTNATHWDAWSLEAILMETLELAKIRAVHADSPGEGGLAALAQLIPAIYLAANVAGDTVATNFRGSRVQQAAVHIAPE